MIHPDYKDVIDYIKKELSVNVENLRRNNPSDSYKEFSSEFNKFNYFLESSEFKISQYYKRFNQIKYFIDCLQKKLEQAYEYRDFLNKSSDLILRSDTGVYSAIRKSNVFKFEIQRIFDQFIRK